MEEAIYNNEDVFNYGNEMNVVLSLLTDKELLTMKDGVNFLKKERVFEIPNFPLSCTGLNLVVYYIQYELARRVGKSIKIVEGEAVRCEKNESVWSNRDWREKAVGVKAVEAELPWSEDTACTPEKIKEETICEPVDEGGDWV